MDKISKALLKLSENERIKVKAILEKLCKNDQNNLQIKKLKGREDIFRVRLGKIRIIYQKNYNQFKILTIERRNDNTYNRNLFSS